MPAATPSVEPIAVIGMSGRFPSAPSVDALWRLLEEGRDGIADAPADRSWVHELYDSEPRTPGRVPTRRGGFLPGLDRFDAAFFDMSPREARRTDPQVRLLLETSQEAFEDAGVPPSTAAGPRTGVFMGTLNNDYWLRQVGDLAALDIYSELGNTQGSLAGRVAYAFGLRGPALCVNTACASSLTSVHLACTALRGGECDIALAGGVNLLLNPFNTLTFASAGVLGPEGRCKFADEDANGYVRSEAVGVVLLKPLERALADGDRVRAVILGSAVNNDGFTGAGMAAPNILAKTELMRAAYGAAGVSPQDVHFVEAHGVGTPAGDRAELQALAEVMGGRKGQCVIGSAKTCVGHSEAAAGVVGLIKSVLSLEHRIVPALPFLGTANPAVDWDEVPLLLPRTPIALPKTGRLLAGVNSFGATGTNTHVVLATPTAQKKKRSHTPEVKDGPSVLALSARSQGALRVLAERYADLLESPVAPPLREVCTAAALQRDHYEHRLGLSATSGAAMAEALRDFLAGQERPGTFVGAADGLVKPKVVFTFPGQGSQWAGMGRELLTLGGTFRETLERCDAVIREYGGFSLLEALHGEDEAWLDDTAKIQPALWAMGVALAAHWRSWGIEPDAVIGHSQGEIVAAHVIGSLTLEEAGKVSCLRARLIGELAPPGGMCWIGLPPEDTRHLLDRLGVQAVIAVEESPVSAVVAGSPQDIAKVVQDCEERDVSCIQVRVEYAAHSSHIDAVREPLVQGLEGIVPRQGSVPFLSTVSATELSGTELDGDYFWRNLRQPVLLEKAVGGSDPALFLLMAPHPVLMGALQSCGVRALESLRRNRPELPSLYGSLAALYAAGYDPDWASALGRPAGRPALPHYPWQRSRYWQQADSFPWPPLGGTTPVVEVQSAVTDSHLTSLDQQRYGFLLDHRVGGRAVLPGAAHFELGLAAARRLGIEAELRDVELRELLVLDDDGLGDVEMAVHVEPAAQDGSRQLAITSRPSGAEHAVMRLARPSGVPPEPADLAGIRDRCAGWQPGDRFYRTHEEHGNSWQGAFRGIAELWTGDGEALARLLPAPESDFVIHPAALDCCLQLTAAVVPLAGERGFVLLGADRVRLHRASVSGALWVHARTGQGLAADLTVYDETGAPVVELVGVRAQQLGTPAPLDSPVADATPLQSLALRWRTVAPGAPPKDPGSWVLISRGVRLERALVKALCATGCSVSTVRPGDGLGRTLKEAAKDGKLRGIVSLVALGGTTDPAAGPEQVEWAASDLCASLLPIVEAHRGLGQPSPRLFVLTEGGQDAADGDSSPAPWQAALWGFGHTIKAESPGQAPILIDLDPDPDPDALAQLLLAQGQEDRLALRGRQALAPRLVREDGQGLALYTRSGFSGLHLVPVARPAPGDGEVEIGVTHAGVNYHDVLEAVAASGPPPMLGGECSGLITRIGPGVRDLAIGDRVMTGRMDALRSHVVTDARCAVRVPSTLTPAEAAAVPIAYGTAYYCLVTLGGLRPGQRVLIHHGTGGVGLAALDIALRRGAVVYATAGSKEKRDLLLRLGASTVADSRGTGFADELRVDGGMDLILSGQAGDAVEANFSLLAPTGQYLDIAMGEMLKGRPLPMSIFAPSRTYHLVDYHLRVMRFPEAHAEILAELTELFEREELAAPRIRVFPAEEAAEAFGLMARSGHIGKLVLRMPEAPVSPAGQAGPSIRSNATYLVTGGASGVGALVAEWLAAQGARHLLLTGRAAPDSERAALLDRLRASGAEVQYASVDVGDERAMRKLVREREQHGLPPVAGVVHSAAVLEPVAMSDVTDADLGQTLHPKVGGGWTLHRLFGDVDFFVLFSSAVSLLSGLRLGGHLGAYAAANAFTDALAAHRRASGLRATVVNWGYWAETGLAHRLSERGGHDVRPPGMLPLRPQDAPDLFATMLGTDGRMIAIPADWDAYLAAYPGDADAPILRELVGDPSPQLDLHIPAPRAAAKPIVHETAFQPYLAPPTPPAAPVRAAVAVKAAPAPAPAQVRATAPAAVPVLAPVAAVARSDSSALEDWLAVQIARVVDLPADRIDRTRPVNRLGVDSLMAAELSTRLNREHGHQTNVSRILKADSIRALAADLTRAKEDR